MSIMEIPAKDCFPILNKPIGQVVHMKMPMQFGNINIINRRGERESALSFFVLCFYMCMCLYRERNKEEKSRRCLSLFAGKRREREIKTEKKE